MNNKRHVHGGVSHVQKVASTTPRPRKRKGQPDSAPGGDPFADLPGAGDVDWMGA